jgi:hypothetical protein
VTPPESRRRGSAWILAPALVSALLFAANWNDYFVGDDFDLIQSFQGKPVSYFPALLWSNESGDVWKSWGIDPALGRGYLRPLKIWILALDAALWGTNPLGFHLTSTAFFVATVLLLFWLLRRALPERPALAAAGACCAAVHPVFAEVVPFVTAREEIASVAFGLASFASWLRYREDGRSPLAFHAFYVLALLTKESGIVFLALPVGWELTQGRLWPLTRAAANDLARAFAPSAAILAVYFALRLVAFGNFLGGDGEPTHYLSPAAFASFHAHFWRSLGDPTLFSLGGLPGASLLPAALALALAGAAAWCLPRVAPERRRALWLYGPVWYLASTSILHGAYFAVRHNILPVVGLMLFAVLVVDALLAAGALRRPRAAALGLLAAAAALFLPPTLATSVEWSAAARGVAQIRATVEERTAGLAPGCAVSLSGIPQWVLPPFFFGWGLRSALQRPFTGSDLARVCTVIDERNLELTRAQLPRPVRYDAVVELDPRRWATPDLRKRYRQRLRREGLLDEGARRLP